MKTTDSSATFKSIDRCRLWPIAMLLLSGACSTAPAVPPDSLYLAEVIGFSFGQATRTMIVQDSKTYRMLLAMGVADEQIRDGSLQRGRVFCCGGPDEGGWTPVFYVPENLDINPGDIVEIQGGHNATGTTMAIAHRATRIVLKNSERTLQSDCHWDPPNEKLWLRVLYCDWMMSDGWRKNKGLGQLWHKTPNKP